MSESESIVCPNCSERSPAGYILCPYCGFDLTKIVRAREKVRVTFKEKFLRIWRSLFDPRESKRLFHEIGVNPDRLGAILVLFLLSAAYGLRVGALTLKAESIQNLGLVYFLIVPWFTAFAFIILAIFGWIVSSLVVWLIAKVLGGKANLRDTLGIVGYSFGPLITASIIICLLIPFWPGDMSSISSSTQEQFRILELINIPFLGLTAYHCGNGIRTAHLLNDYYSYGISGAITLLYILGFLLPAVGINLLTL